MENTQSGQPNNAAWSSPAERKQTEHSKRASNEGRPTNKAGSEKPPVNAEAAAREATIWERPEDGAAFAFRASRPAYAPEQPVPSYEPSVQKPEALRIQPQPEPAPTPETIMNPKTPEPTPNPNQGPSDELRKAVEQAYEAQREQQNEAQKRQAEAPVAPPPLENNPEWMESYSKAQVRGYNPDRPPQTPRPYFWTDPEVRQSGQRPEHDVLPPVLPPHENEAKSQPETHDGIPAVDPVLAQAINPNLSAETPLTAVAPIPDIRPGVPVESAPSGSSESDQDAFTRRPIVEQQPPAGGPEQGPVTQEAPGAPMEFPTPTRAIRKERPVEAAESSSPSGMPARSPELEERTRNMETELSKTIYIDGLSVYDMFIGKQIDQEGLHRIISAYVGGGDVKKVTLQEIARQQVRFERDPQMRTAPLAQPAERSSEVPTSPPTQTSMPQQPPAAMTKPMPQSFTERAEKLADMTQGASERMQDLIQHPRFGAIASFIAIVAIYTAIIIIILT